jgi:hypothetical protein
MAGIDYESEWMGEGVNNEEWEAWAESLEKLPIVRSYDTDPMAKIGRLALPWTTLTMLLTAGGAVVVALWEKGRLVIMVGAGVLLLARWIWQSRQAVVGYSRRQGRGKR